MTGKELYDSCFCAMNWEHNNEFVNAEFHLKSGAMHLVCIEDIYEYFNCYDLEDYEKLASREEQWQDIFIVHKDSSMVSFGIDSIEYIEVFR